MTTAVKSPEATTVSDFLTLYRKGQLAVFHRAFSCAVADEGIESLARTLRTVLLFVDESDVEPYMHYVYRWAKARGIRADHRLLRSPKMLSSFIRRTNRQDRAGFANTQVLRDQMLLRGRKTFGEEISALVFKARGVYQSAGHDWAYAFLIALDSCHWEHQERLAALCRRVLQGDQMSIRIMRERGLHEAI